MAWVLGARALNLNMTAFLAAGNLTWNDVQKAEFPSFGASARAAIEGKVDCFIASTNSGNLRAGSSPRKYVPAAVPPPEKDAGAWQRLRRAAPYFEPNAATIGAPPVSKEAPAEGATYGYPIISTYDFQDAERCIARRRWFTSSSQSQGGLARQRGLRARRPAAQVGRAVSPGRSPLFEGEEGLDGRSGPAQPRAARRQEVLAAAWLRAQDEAQAQKAGVAKLPDIWMKIRTEELKKAGLDPYWEAKFW